MLNKRPWESVKLLPQIHKKKEKAVSVTLSFFLQGLPSMGSTILIP